MFVRWQRETFFLPLLYDVCKPREKRIKELISKVRGKHVFCPEVSLSLSEPGRDKLIQLSDPIKYNIKI